MEPFETNPRTENMTLWDHAFIHAPQEIPEWFECPSLETPPVTPPNEESYLKDYIPESVFARMHNWRMDPCYDLLDDSGLTSSAKKELFDNVVILSEFEKSWKNYWKKTAEMAANRKISRYFAWRSFFADQTLKAYSG